MLETTPAIVISGDVGRTHRWASASDNLSHFQATSARELLDGERGYY